MTPENYYIIIFKNFLYLTGDFNVAERVQEEYSIADKTSSSLFLSGFVTAIMACRVML